MTTNLQALSLIVVVGAIAGCATTLPPRAITSSCDVIQADADKQYAECTTGTNPGEIVDAALSVLPVPMFGPSSAELRERYCRAIQAEGARAVAWCRAHIDECPHKKVVYEWTTEYTGFFSGHQLVAKVDCPSVIVRGRASLVKVHPPSVGPIARFLKAFAVRSQYRRRIGRGD